ncbi:MAG: type II secretion system F family protein [Pirellulales bacterium]|nr:type II secretion system F family protein [Pirellulales bacterium]
MPLLTKVAIFGGVACGAWVLLEILSHQKPRAEARLEDFSDPTRRRGEQVGGPRSVTKRADGMARLLEKASPKMAKPLQPKSEEDVSKLRAKLNYAGFRAESASSIFLGLKTICLAIGFVAGGGALFFTKGATGEAVMYTIGTAGVAFYLPEVILWFLTKSRQDNIFFGLPDALDLMVVCVEAGLGLDQAMRKVSDEMKKTYAVIAEEFGLCNLQLQMGRARNDVLHDLGARTGVDDLKALAAILIQADKFGSSVAQALRVQSDSMRTRRRQMAEEKAAKTAVKLIFPLVLFIFPAIFIVLVGPAAITMVNEMFPAMSGGK